MAFVLVVLGIVAAASVLLALIRWDVRRGRPAVHDEAPGDVPPPPEPSKPAPLRDM